MNDDHYGMSLMFITSHYFTEPMQILS